MLASWTFYSRISYFPINFPLASIREFPTLLGIFFFFPCNWRLSQLLFLWGRILKTVGPACAFLSKGSYRGWEWGLCLDHSHPMEEIHVCGLYLLSHTYEVTLSSTNCYWPKKNDNKIIFLPIICFKTRLWESLLFNTYSHETAC